MDYTAATVHLMNSYSDEVKSKFSRLDMLVGRAHWLSVGTFRETIVKEMVSKITPSKYSIGTGFVVSPGKDNSLMKSKQIDIIIWNSHDFSPIFKSDDFVVVLAQSVAATIEVKSIIKRSDIEEALRNIESLDPLIRNAEFSATPETHGMRKYPFPRYIVAFDTKSDSFHKNGIYKTLLKHYKATARGKLEETELSTTMTGKLFNLSYGAFVSGICVINKGFIGGHVFEVQSNQRHGPYTGMSYVDYNTIRYKGHANQHIFDFSPIGWFLAELNHALVSPTSFAVSRYTHFAKQSRVLFLPEAPELREYYPNLYEE